MGIGGLIGLWFGYTTELTAIQSGRVSVALRIISMFLVYWSVYQLELSIILIIIMWTDVPSTLIRKMFGQGYSLPSTVKMSRTDRNLLIYKENPSELAKLSPKRRKQILEQLDNKHLTIAYQFYEAS